MNATGDNWHVWNPYNLKDRAKWRTGLESAIPSQAIPQAGAEQLTQLTHPLNLESRNILPEKLTCSTSSFRKWGWHRKSLLGRDVVCLSCLHPTPSFTQLHSKFPMSCHMCSTSTTCHLVLRWLMARCYMQLLYNLKLLHSWQGVSGVLNTSWSTSHRHRTRGSWVGYMGGNPLITNLSYKLVCWGVMNQAEAVKNGVWPIDCELWRACWCVPFFSFIQSFNGVEQVNE